MLWLFEDHPEDTEEECPPRQASTPLWIFFDIVPALQYSDKIMNLRFLVFTHYCLTNTKRCISVCFSKSYLSDYEKGAYLAANDLFHHTFKSLISCQHPSFPQSRRSSSCWKSNRVLRHFTTRQFTPCKVES